MADRTVRVLLTGNSTPLARSMRDGARAAAGAASSIQRSAGTASRSAARQWQTATRQMRTHTRAWAGDTARAMGRAGAASAAAYRSMTGQARTWARSARAAAASARAGVVSSLGQMAVRSDAAWTRMQARASAAATRTASRWTAAATAVSARWSAVQAGMSGRWAQVTAAATAAAGRTAARWSAAAAGAGTRWTAWQTGMSARWAAVQGSAGRAAARVSARWGTAAAWVSARWAATAAAVTGAMASAAAGSGLSRAVGMAWGRAATWATSRWTAAAAAITAAQAAVGATASSAAAAAASAWTAAAARAAAAQTVVSGAAGTAAAWTTARWTAAAGTVSARWTAAQAAMSARWAAVTAAAGSSAGAVTARWNASSSAVSARWAAAQAAMAARWGAFTAGSSAAAATVAARWTAASAAVSARWSAAQAAMSARWAAVTAAATGAAGRVASRWGAALAAVRAAASGMAGAVTLAGAAAGASLLHTARAGEKSLRAARAASLGLAAVFALAVFAAARFDHAMSGVAAVSDATAREMQALRGAALEAGRTTQYSAVQAAQAEEELAKAGVTVADIAGGALKGALDLAASAQVDVAESAEIAANAMTIFGLRGKDVGHVADVLASGANKSTTDVHQLGMSLKMGGLVARQTGLDLEDTVGVLSLFASKALKGSDAGTSLKVMLQRLTPNSKEAQATMDRLGFSAYDAQGNFVGLEELAARLKTAFSNLTPEARNSAMGVIFGSDAVRAASILYQAGAEGVRTWTSAVDDQGYAAAVAARRLDNLTGDLKFLKAALETAFIDSGSAANGVLREMAQVLTGVVNGYNGLPSGIQKTITLGGGLVGILGLVGTGLLLMLPRIMAVRAELTALGVTAARVRGAMMGLGRMGVVLVGLAAISYGVEQLMSRFDDAPPSVAKLQNSLIDLARTGKASGEVSRVLGKGLDDFGKAAARVAHPGVLERIGDTLYEITHLGIGADYDLEQATKKLKGVDDALASLAQSGGRGPALAADAFKRLAKEANRGGTSTEKLRSLLPGYTDALASLDSQAKVTSGGQGKLGDETAMTADEMADQRSEAEKLSDALNTLNGAAISSAEAEIGFRESLAGLSEAVKENGKSLDTASDRGRKVKSAFLDAAKAAQKHAEAVSEQEQSQAAGTKVLERDISALKRQMKQLGFTDSQIRRLIGTYAQLPETKQTGVKSPGADKSIRQMIDLKTKIRDVPPGKSITVKAPTGAAVKALKDVGYKVKTLPDGRISITVPTSGARAALAALQHRINAMRGRTIDIWVRHNTSGRPTGGEGGRSRFADGGIAERVRARDGLYVPGYAPRVDDVPAVLSRGEGVLVPETVRKGAQATGQTPAAFVKSLNMWGRYGQAFASGGIAGLGTYTPAGAPALGGPSDAKQRYDQEVQDLKDAWKSLTAAMADARKKADAVRDAEKNLARVRRSRPTRKQLGSARDRLEDARKARAKAGAKARHARGDVSDAARELGLKGGAKPPKGFTLTAYVTQLDESVAATEKWRRSLTRIGGRGGQEIRDLLEGMGEDGYALVNALAGASDKQFKSIASKLKKTADQAKASLKDFNKQVEGSNTANAEFAADLQTLAARGHGALAQQLAAQGDQAAMDLAAQAAGASDADLNKVGVNLARAGSVLTGDDLAAALAVLTTLRTRPGQGIGDLAAAGIDYGTLRSVVPRILGQIKKLPEANRQKFLSQWAAQGGAAAMDRGGILRDGSYTVLAGERGTGGELYAPLGGRHRDRSVPLIAAGAARFGYRLVPAGRFPDRRPDARAPAVQATRHVEIHLHGAKQTSGEQLRDLARQLAFVG